jgi:hypothetical protein
VCVVIWEETVSEVRCRCRLVQRSKLVRRFFRIGK